MGPRAPIASLTFVPCEALRKPLGVTLTGALARVRAYFENPALIAAYTLPVYTAFFPVGDESVEVLMQEVSGDTPAYTRRDLFARVKKLSGDSKAAYEKFCATLPQELSRLQVPLTVSEGSLGSYAVTTRGSDFSAEVVQIDPEWVIAIEQCTEEEVLEAHEVLLFFVLVHEAHHVITAILLKFFNSEKQEDVKRDAKGRRLSLPMLNRTPPRLGPYVTHEGDELGDAGIGWEHVAVDGTLGFLTTSPKPPPFAGLDSLTVNRVGVSGKNYLMIPRSAFQRVTVSALETWTLKCHGPNSRGLPQDTPLSFFDGLLVKSTTAQPRNKDGKPLYVIQKKLTSSHAPALSRADGLVPISMRSLPPRRKA